MKGLEFSTLLKTCFSSHWKHLVVFLIWEAAYGLLLLKIESTVGPLGRILGVFGVLYLSYFCGWQIGLLTFPIFLGFHVWLHSVYDLEWLQGILGPPLATAAAILFGILGNTYRRAREAERRLGDALRTLQEQGSFLARASHELRTPLNAISGHTQLLLRQPDNGFRNSLQQILGASNQLEGLIHNVLEMAQLEKGTVRLEKKAESLPGLIGLVASMAEPEAARKGLGMVVNIDPSLPELLELDRVRLMQVLSNILGNAVRYSDAGTIRIDVSTGESGGPEGSIMVQFSVEDQGTGIRPESLVTIFEPFVQASRRPQQGSGSVGLGLSISRELVRSMGGELKVESEPGIGSRFYFSLPLFPALSAERKAETEDGGELGTGREIWVAEDNAMNRLVIEKMLEELGYSCELFSNGMELLQALNSTERLPAALLIDGLMPELDGFEAAGRIQSLKKEISSIPRILITADTTLLSSEERIGEGLFHDTLLKPVDLEELRFVLTRFLSRKPD